MDGFAETETFRDSSDLGSARIVPGKECSSAQEEGNAK